MLDWRADLKRGASGWPGSGRMIRLLWGLPIGPPVTPWARFTRFGGTTGVRTDGAFVAPAASVGTFVAGLLGVGGPGCAPACQESGSLSRFSSFCAV